MEGIRSTVLKKSHFLGSWPKNSSFANRSLLGEGVRGRGGEGVTAEQSAKKRAFLTLY